MATWYRSEFGCDEGGFTTVKRNFSVSIGSDGYYLKSKLSGKKHFVGVFDTPSVFELHTLLNSICSNHELGGLTFKNVSSCSRRLHLDPLNAGSVFQVASQMNCFEMTGPNLHSITFNCIHVGITSRSRRHR